MYSMIGNSQAQREYRLVISGVLAIGLLLRLMLLPHPGFEADVSFWKSWGLGMLDGGIVWAAHNTNSNYPTPFFYVLGGIVKVYSFFADPHDFTVFWSNTNILFLVVSKLPSVIADFAIFFLILWLGKKAHKIGFPQLSGDNSMLLAGLYLLSPVSLIDGAWWGQVDSLGVVLFLLALFSAWHRKPFLAGILYMVSMMTKLQNMIYGPLFLLYLWQLTGFKGLLKAIIGSGISFLGLNIEFFLARDMARVMASLTENYDYFPWMSLNAFNVWWIVSGARGMQVSDKLLAVGLMNAKSTGLLLFSSFYLLAVLHLAKDSLLEMFKTSAKINQVDQTMLTRHFLESLIVAAGGFFLFQTQSHDRYAFPLTVFLLLLAPFIFQQKKLKKIFLLLYGLFLITYFYNLHTALVINYPNNGLPFLSSLTQPFFTHLASGIQIGLFLIFLLYVAKRTNLLVCLIPVGYVVLMLLIQNLPLVTKKPVSVTKFKPFINQQGYGQLMTNMPINASLGFNKWSPLSVQYMFYRKGLGTHAPSRVYYDIGRHFSRFTSDYGIDTEAGDKGTAVFEVYGDGNRLFSSTKIGRFDLPRHIDISISGIQTLTLVTADAGDGKNDDHTDWLNPVLYP